MFRIMLVIFCLLAPTTTLAGNTTHSPQFTMSIISPPPPFMRAWLNKIYSEAFRRLGKEFVLVEFPARRATLMAETGSIDGEVLRDRDYQEMTSGLIRLEPPIFQYKLNAYAVRRGLKVSSWDDLRTQKLRIATLRGMKIAEKMTTRHLPNATIIEVADVYRGFHLLMNNRYDVLLAAPSAVHDSDNVPPQLYSAGTLHSATAHGYLNAKHREIAAQLGKVLGLMRKEGLFDKYYKEVHDLSLN